MVKPFIFIFLKRKAYEKKKKKKKKPNKQDFLKMGYTDNPQTIHLDPESPTHLV